MAEQKDKKDVTKKRFRWGYLLAVAAVCFVVFSFCQQYLRFTEIREQQQMLVAQLEQCQQQQQELQTQQALLNDDDYMENLAREKLGMVKQGEIRVMTMQESEALEQATGKIDIH